MGLVQTHLGLKPQSYLYIAILFKCVLHTAHICIGIQNTDLKNSETMCTKSTDTGGMTAASCTYAACEDSMGPMMGCLTKK